MSPPDLDDLLPLLGLGRQGVVQLLEPRQENAMCLFSPKPAQTKTKTLNAYLVSVPVSFERY